MLFNMYGSYTKFTYHNYGTLQLQYLSQDTSITLTIFTKVIYHILHTKLICTCPFCILIQFDKYYLPAKLILKTKKKECSVPKADFFKLLGF